MQKIWVGSAGVLDTGEKAAQKLQETNDGCYWSPDYGIESVNKDRWEQAQRYEKDTWMRLLPHAKDDRNGEHAARFDHYKTAPENLGVAIEIGCGPFTQIKTLINKRKATAEHVYLLDPLIDSYIKHPHCTYSDGTLCGIATTRIASSIEDYAEPQKFDTIVCINVFEHIYNAPLAFFNLRVMLKPGGTLVFHERSWDNFTPTHLYDIGHPIRIRKDLIDGFLEYFKESYSWVADHAVLGDKYGTSIYYIGTKLPLRDVPESWTTSCQNAECKSWFIHKNEPTICPNCGTDKVDIKHHPASQYNPDDPFHMAFDKSELQGRDFVQIDPNGFRQIDQ